MSRFVTAHNSNISFHGRPSLVSRHFFDFEFVTCWMLINVNKRKIKVPLIFLQLLRIRSIWRCPSELADRMSKHWHGFFNITFSNNFMEIAKIFWTSQRRTTIKDKYLRNRWELFNFLIYQAKLRLGRKSENFWTCRRSFQTLPD